MVSGGVQTLGWEGVGLGAELGGWNVDRSHAVSLRFGATLFTRDDVL